METSVVFFSNKQCEQEIRKKYSMYSRIIKKKISRYKLNQGWTRLAYRKLQHITEKN